MIEPRVFQITPEMIKASTTLTNQDLGLWCYIIKGRYYGFTTTRSDAYLSYRFLYPNEVKLRD